VEFVLEIEGRMCKAFLCIPYGSVEPIKEKLYSAFSADRDDLDVKWLERLKGRLKETSVTLTGILGSTILTVSEVLAMNEGDVLDLDTNVDDDLRVTVEELTSLEPSLACSGDTGL